MSQTFEPERDRRRGAAEHRDRDRVRKPDAERTDVGRKQFGLHDGIDRGIARDEDPRGANQQKRRERRSRVLQHRQNGDRRRRAGDTQKYQQRFAADAIGDRAIERLQEGREDQRAENYKGRLIFGEADRQFDVGLHVGGEGVEGGCTAGRQPDDQQQLARIFQQAADRAGGSGDLLRFDENVAFMQLAPHHGRDDRQQRADHERNSPAPTLQFLGRQKHFLQQQQDYDRGELSADQGDVLKAGIEAAMLGVGDFAEISGAGAVFAAEAQSFDDAGQRQQRRRGQANRGVGWRHRDDQRAETHAEHRQR